MLVLALEKAGNEVGVKYKTFLEAVGKRQTISDKIS